MKVADTFRQFFFLSPQTRQKMMAILPATVSKQQLLLQLHTCVKWQNTKVYLKKIIFYICLTGISFHWSVDKLLMQETLYLTSLWFKNLFYEFLWITY